MTSYHPSKTTWLNPNIEYLFNEEIIEYDIHDAGFSIIQQYHLLPPEKIRELEGIQRGVKRHIAVGMLQRDDKEFSKRLADKFAEVRQLFLMMNQLNDDRILSVKKDAIYTLGKCKRTTFGKVRFAEKNTYTSYIRFPDVNNLELYYGPNGIDVKGMGELAVNRHRLYLLEFIRMLFRLIEDQDTSVRRKFMRFLNQYKAGELEEEYYIEFNNLSREPNKLFNYQNILLPLLKIILREVN